MKKILERKVKYLQIAFSMKVSNRRYIIFQYLMKGALLVRMNHISSHDEDECDSST